MSLVGAASRAGATAMAAVLAFGAAAAGAGPATTAGGAALLPQVATAGPSGTSAAGAASAGGASGGVPIGCTFPDGGALAGLHCYTPQQIRSAFGVDSVPALGSGPNYGQGQTIVLVDSYGSPTAASDLLAFHDQFFPDLPDPSFEQIFPQGNPQYMNACNSAGLSGPCAAANWSGEATLDIEWSYAIAPEANIVLLAVPPAETEGVQGFPNLFKAISDEIDATPPGTVFSLSFAVTEQTFGGNAAAQLSRFDAVFQKGLAKRDNFFAATGDTGSLNLAKQHEESTYYPYPTAQWPATSPYVVAVGGTQLQYGWTWDPSSNDPFLPGQSVSFRHDRGLNPDYWNWTPSGDTQAVWNESWADIGGGGGASAVYPRPQWQAGVGAAYGDHRLVPDTAWNAAVNGGVEVYITAYPGYNCGNATGCWSDYGGTSAATPQTAALVALANAARADAGEAPIGFLDPILYQDGVGSSASAYTDVVAHSFGTATQSFAGSEVGVAGPVPKSAGDLQDNQMWQVPVAGYPTTTGWDATTGWGVPDAAGLVAALVGS